MVYMAIISQMTVGKSPRSEMRDDTKNTNEKMHVMKDGRKSSVLLLQGFSRIT